MSINIRNPIEGKKMEDIIINLLKTNTDLINAVNEYINSNLDINTISKKGGLSYNYDFIFEYNDTIYYGEVKKNENLGTNIFRLPEILQIMGSNKEVSNIMKSIITKAYEILTNAPKEAYKNYDRMKDNYREFINEFRNISLSKYTKLVNSIKANEIDKYYNLLDKDYINSIWNEYVNSILYEIPQDNIEYFVDYIVKRISEQVNKIFFLVNIIPDSEDETKHIQIYLNHMYPFEYLHRYEIKDRNIIIYTDKYIIKCLLTFRNTKLKRNPAFQMKLMLNNENYSSIYDVLNISKPIDIYYN